MQRFLLAFPAALLTCYSLLGIMAWMVEFDGQEITPVKQSLRFNMLAVEKPQSSQRKNRTLPEPPAPTPKPTAPEQTNAQPRPQLASPTLAAMPELKMDLSVSAIKLSAPSLSAKQPEVNISKPAQLAVQTDSNQQLMPLHRLEPVYPRKALKRKIEGYVILSFVIDSTGKPQNIQVKEAKPARIFNRTAIKALTNWKYQPRIVNGHAQAIPGQEIKLEFKIRK